MQFTPAARASGSATITVTVEDGGLDGDFNTTEDNLTVTETFTLTVNNVNDPPTISPIDDLTINEDAVTQTVSLTGITAGDGEIQPLKVTAASSNTALIAAPTVSYTSDDATGSLQFTPVADQYGTAVIMIMIEDGGLDENLATTEDNGFTNLAFLAQVAAVNDTPTLDSLANLTINEDDPEQIVDLTGISAGGGEIQPLRVTATSSNTDLIPTPTVNYTSDDATGLSLIHISEPTRPY